MLATLEAHPDAPQRVRKTLRPRRIPRPIHRPQIHPLIQGGRPHRVQPLALALGAQTHAQIPVRPRGKAGVACALRGFGLRQAQRRPHGARQLRQAAQPGGKRGEDGGQGVSGVDQLLRDAG